jgi:hypothetical protein
MEYIGGSEAGPEHNENQLLQGIYVQRLLDTLTDEERRIAVGYMEGYSAKELGVNQWQQRKVFHKLAVEAGAEFTCHKCNTRKSATEFYADSHTLCSACKMARPPGYVVTTTPKRSQCGTASAYRRGCRCEACRAAKSAAVRKSRERRA